MDFGVSAVGTNHHLILPEDEQIPEPVKKAPLGELAKTLKNESSDESPRNRWSRIIMPRMRPTYWTTLKSSNRKVVGTMAARFSKAPGVDAHAAIGL